MMTAARRYLQIGGGKSFHTQYLRYAVKPIDGHNGHNGREKPLLGQRKIFNGINFFVPFI